MSIYVSTGGVKNQSCIRTAEMFYDAGINSIELSGGNYDPYFIEGLDKLIARGANLTLHNYVPYWPEPYVVNLASSDDTVYQRSIEHIRKSIELSAYIGSKWFAFHAGYLLNPKPTELGKPLSKMEIAPHGEYLRKFKKSYIELLPYAEEYGINLLIENNVLSRLNSVQFEKNPLLLCDPIEIAGFFNDIRNSNSGLLLDLAHLKVSSRSLNFNLETGLKQIAPFVKGYHLSDNDGTEDSNEEIDKNSWFMPYMDHQEYTVIEVYTDSIDKLVKQVKLIEEG